MTNKLKDPSSSYRWFNTYISFAQNMITVQIKGHISNKITEYNLKEALKN